MEIFGPGGLAPKFNPRSPVSLASQVDPKGWQATAQIVRVTRARSTRNLNFSKKFWQAISPKPEVMYFGLDIFTEAVGDVYIVWKFGVGGPRIGDDINEKRKPDLAYRKKCMYS